MIINFNNNKAVITMSPQSTYIGYNHEKILSKKHRSKFKSHIIVS